jgi:Domain of unknown function (DUF1772)
MIVKTWRFITIILVALTMGMAFCHTLELPAKIQYDRGLYVTLQNSLYLSFGTIGAVIEVGALLAALVLSFLVRKHRTAFIWTVIGAVCLAVALAIWFAWILPVNIEISKWTAASVPENWMRLRDQWEYAHATRFIIQLIGFSTLILSILNEIPPMIPNTASLSRG